MAFEVTNHLPAEMEIDEELPVGTVLLHGQYKITRLLNSGGFGITYLAKDSLDRNVVIKECFVSAFCRRTKSRVRARSQGSKANLDLVVRHFLNEARRLASLTHPNIVNVRQVFEENDTAYMALDFIEGEDLLDVVEKRPGWLGPARIVGITSKLVSALGYVHDHGLLHCDISPDNIFLDKRGEPILIDFGAARLLRLGQAAKNSGPLVVKDGYSPQELYFSGGNTGPWTDIYSLAASIAHCVTGEAPVTSQSRLAALVERRVDPHVHLAGRFEGYPDGFLESLDRAMSVMPATRFQTTDEWLDELNQLEELEGKNVRLFRRPGPRQPPTETPQPTPAPKVQVAEVPAAAPSPQPKGKKMAIKLTGLAEIGGFIGGCLVDSDTGLMMASEGGAGFDLEAASAANTEVVKAKLQAIKLLGLDDHIDDILISLGKQLHLIRPLEKSPAIFIYVALDKKAANLGMARVQVKKVEQSISM
jgi:serine/threonine protein kinase/predicted regulator of Ras-like GTPase activity (Roadblock/LC7/MglB family)